MADERGAEAEIFGSGGWRRHPLDIERLSSALAGGAQRARLLVNGVAGPLSERQRALALDILRELERLCDEAGAVSESLKIKREPFELSALCADVIGAYRFVAHRKQLAVSLLGVRRQSLCLADPRVVREALMGALGAALQAAVNGARVSLVLACSAEQVSLELSTPGWNPRLPPTPPVDSGLALSVLRTSSGARLVFSLQVPS